MEIFERHNRFLYKVKLFINETHLLIVNTQHVISNLLIHDTKFDFEFLENNYKKSL